MTIVENQEVQIIIGKFWSSVTLVKITLYLKF